jgi:O-antigen/teichoic acid export membrane protein
MANNTPSAKRTGINTISTWAYKISVSAISLVTIPIILQHLGVAGLGVWLLVLQFSRHFQLLSMGINTSLGRFLAKMEALEDRAGKEAYLSVCVLSLSMIGVLVLICAFFIAKGFSSYTDIGAEYENEVFWVVLLSIINVGLSLPLRTGDGMLASLHRFDRIALWEIMAQVVWMAGLVSVFYMGKASLLSLALVYFIPFIARDFCLFIDGLRVQSWPRISKDGFKWNIFSDTISVSSSAAFITFGAMLTRQGAPMLVGFTEGLEAVSLISIPLLILFGITPFINTIARQLSPVASSLAAVGEKTKLLGFYCMCARYAQSMAILGALLLSQFGEQALLLWLGDTVSATQRSFMYNTILFLMCAFALSVPSLVSRSVLVAVGIHWKAAKAEVWSNVSGICVGLLLMTTGGMGTFGMVIGIAITFLLRGFGSLMMCTGRYFEVSTWYLHLRTTIPSVMIGIVSIGIFQFLIHLHMPVWTGWVIPAIFWMIGTWIIIVETEHKKLLLKAIVRHKHPVKA